MKIDIKFYSVCSAKTKVHEMSVKIEFLNVYFLESKIYKKKIQTDL